MSATTSKPAARIVSPVSTRSTEEKNPLNSSTDAGSDKMYLNLNNNILSHVIFSKLK